LNSVYQVSSQKIKTISAENYYKISQQKPSNDYEKLVPENYKKKIDRFFEKLVKTYS